MLRLLESHGWSRQRCVPHAGHLLAFNVVAGLGLGGHEMSARGPFTLPVENGHARPGDAPGVGFEALAPALRFFDGLLA